MYVYKVDELDLYRLKKAETDRERVQVMEEAVAKAVEKAQMNYLLICLMVAVSMVVLLQSLAMMDLNPVPVASFKWCILVATILIVLPWQLRRIKLLA
jgi:uncharacterized integral membrane protein